MSSDDLTKHTPTEDKLESLISLVQQIAAEVQWIAADVKSLNNRVDSLDQKVNSLDQKVNSLDQKVDSLDQKVDARLHETRPIWEGVLARLEELEISMDKVRAITHDTRGDLRELRRELKEHLPALK